MSLYRQAGGLGARALAGAAVAGLLIGLLSGYLVGRASVEEPSLSDLVAEARAELQPVSAGLELVPIEYEGALRDGRVAEPSEYRATRGAVERAGSALETAAEDLRAIDAAGYAAATRSVDQLTAAIDSVAPPARIEALAARASARVESLAGSE